MNSVILDTNVLIKLRKAGLIDCLGDLFDSVILPYAVKNELIDLLTNLEISKPFFEIAHVCNLLPISGIGLGELEVISLAVERNINTIYTDDKRAIKKALQFNLMPVTTFSLLVFFKKKGLIDSVKNRLDLMRVKGEFFEDELYFNTLRFAGEL